MLAAARCSTSTAKALLDTAKHCACAALCQIPMSDAALMQRSLSCGNTDKAGQQGDAAAQAHLEQQVPVDKPGCVCQAYKLHQLGHLHVLCCM